MSEIKSIQKKIENKQPSNLEAEQALLGSILINNDIIDELTKLKGIGEWTAQMYLIFQLNWQDVVPVLDIGFINSFKKIYKINDIKSKKSEQILQSWKPYSTVAVWYIWRVIDPDVVQY